MLFLTVLGSKTSLREEELLIMFVIHSHDWKEFDIKAKLSMLANDLVCDSEATFKGGWGYYCCYFQFLWLTAVCYVPKSVYLPSVFRWKYYLSISAQCTHLSLVLFPSVSVVVIKF